MVTIHTSSNPHTYIIYESFPAETINVCSPSSRLVDPPRFGQTDTTPHHAKTLKVAKLFLAHQISPSLFLFPCRPYKPRSAQIRYLHAICCTFKKNKKEPVSIVPSLYCSCLIRTLPMKEAQLDRVIIDGKALDADNKSVKGLRLCKGCSMWSL